MNSALEYAEQQPTLTVANGQIYGFCYVKGVWTVHKIDVIECPECGDFSEFQRGRTKCCGKVSEVDADE